MSNIITRLKPVLALILALITPMLTLICCDPFVKLDSEIEVALEKSDGFIKGVCHPEPDYELIKEANIGWIREDIPFPYLPDGSVNPWYTEWKEEMLGYAQNGIKVMAITPYPEDYIAYGLDPREEENIEGIQDIARFFVEDLKGIVGAFQITNEMGIDRFTYPLTMEEAYEFVGIQLEAMHPVKGDILVGYNLAGLSIATMPIKMAPWNEYCDYVGVDLYLGCFEDILKNINQFTTVLTFVRRVTGKPVILCEFGYIGLGEPKTEEEKAEILKGYGYDSEEQARADIDNFISALPEDLADEFIKYADETPEYRASQMFDGEYSNHLYRELPEGFGLYGYEHSPEGQAKFFSDLIPKIRNLDFVIGSFIYCWEDSGDCYVCGQVDCPVETKWGLVDHEGNPKPSFYAVKEAFAD